MISDTCARLQQPEGGEESSSRAYDAKNIPSPCSPAECCSLPARGSIFMYFTSTGLVILYTRHLGSGRPRCIGGVPGRADVLSLFMYYYSITRYSLGAGTVRAETP